MAMIKPKIWINVPDGSAFSAMSLGTNDNYQIDMSIDSSGNDDADWDDFSIKSGRSMMLQSPNNYVVVVRINFAGLPPPSVTYTARIVRSDGTQHNGIYQFTVSDPTQSPYRATMGIVTVAGGAE